MMNEIEYVNHIHTPLWLLCARCPSLLYHSDDNTIAVRTRSTYNTAYILPGALTEFEYNHDIP